METDETVLRTPVGQREHKSSGGGSDSERKLKDLLRKKHACVLESNEKLREAEKLREIETSRVKKLRVELEEMRTRLQEKYARAASDANVDDSSVLETATGVEVEKPLDEEKGFTLAISDSRDTHIVALSSPTPPIAIPSVGGGSLTVESNAMPVISAETLLETLSVVTRESKLRRESEGLPGTIDPLSLLSEAVANVTQESSPLTSAGEPLGIAVAIYYNQDGSSSTSAWREPRMTVRKGVRNDCCIANNVSVDDVLSSTSVLTAFRAPKAVPGVLVTAAHERRSVARSMEIPLVIGDDRYIHCDGVEIWQPMLEGSSLLRVVLIWGPRIGRSKIQIDTRACVQIVERTASSLASILPTFLAIAVNERREASTGTLEATEGATAVVRVAPAHSESRAREKSVVSSAPSTKTPDDKFEDDEDVAGGDVDNADDATAAVSAASARHVQAHAEARVEELERSLRIEGQQRASAMSEVSELKRALRLLRQRAEDSASVRSEAITEKEEEEDVMTETKKNSEDIETVAAGAAKRLDDDENEDAEDVDESRADYASILEMSATMNRLVSALKDDKSRLVKSTADLRSSREISASVATPTTKTSDDDIARLRQRFDALRSPSSFVVEAKRRTTGASSSSSSSETGSARTSSAGIFRLVESHDAYRREVADAEAHMEARLQEAMRNNIVLQSEMDDLERSFSEERVESEISQRKRLDVFQSKVIQLQSRCDELQSRATCESKSAATVAVRQRLIANALAALEGEKNSWARRLKAAALEFGVQSTEERALFQKERSRLEKEVNVLTQELCEAEHEQRAVLNRSVEEIRDVQLMGSQSENAARAWAEEAVAKATAFGRWRSNSQADTIAGLRQSLRASLEAQMKMKQQFEEEQDRAREQLFRTSRKLDRSESRAASAREEGVESCELRYREKLLAESDEVRRLQQLCTSLLAEIDEEKRERERSLKTSALDSEDEEELSRLRRWCRQHESDAEIVTKLRTRCRLYEAEVETEHEVAALAKKKALRVAAAAHRDMALADEAIAEADRRFHESEAMLAGIRKESESTPTLSIEARRGGASGKSVRYTIHSSSGGSKRRSKSHRANRWHASHHTNGPFF